jgi:hypothetical protein
LRINDEFGKRIHATDMLLESIRGKMDNFTVAKQNQLSFNKMLETQIQQIAAALPHQSNGDPSQSSIQESVKSIFIVFMGKAPKSTGGSLGGVGPENAMTPDNEPSVAENFSMKSTRRVKDATSAVTSSLVAQAI